MEVSTVTSSVTLVQALGKPHGNTLLLVPCDGSWKKGIPRTPPKGRNIQPAIHGLAWGRGKNCDLEDKTSSTDRLERIILVRKIGKMQVIGTLKCFDGVVGMKARLERIYKKGWQREESRQQRERNRAVARGRGLVRGMFFPLVLRMKDVFMLLGMIEGKINNAGEARRGIQCLIYSNSLSTYKKET